MRPIMTAGLAVLLSAGCGPTVMYQRSATAPIAAAARWAWGEPDRDGLSIKEGALVPTDSVARMIADAIEQGLTARGFVRTSPESAQFVVHFHVAQRRVTDTLPPRDDPTASGIITEPGTWGGYGRPEDIDERAVTWEEGMLVVDALTPDGRVVAWRGMIADEIPPEAVQDPKAAIRKAVRRLLRGFP
jgi:hypothetical protein